MKQSIKGVLLSGLIFPGLGQVLLGAKKRGWLIVLTAIACLVAIVVVATQTALVVLEQLGDEGKPLNTDTISEAAIRASTESGSSLFSFFLLALLLCWLFSVVDAYRIGARRDSEN